MSDSISGGDDSSYKHMISKHLSCPVCKGLLDDAVAVSCGHTFCQKCLLVWLSTRPSLDHWSCPECRHAIGPPQLSPIFSIRALMSDVKAIDSPQCKTKVYRESKSAGYTNVEEKSKATNDERDETIGISASTNASITAPSDLQDESSLLTQQSPNVESSRSTLQLSYSTQHLLYQKEQLEAKLKDVCLKKKILLVEQKISRLEERANATQEMNRSLGERLQEVKAVLTQCQVNSTRLMNESYQLIKRMINES